MLDAHGQQCFKWERQQTDNLVTYLVYFIHLTAHLKSITSDSLLSQRLNWLFACLIFLPCWKSFFYVQIEKKNPLKLRQTWSSGRWGLLARPQGWALANSGGRDEYCSATCSSSGSLEGVLTFCPSACLSIRGKQRLDDTWRWGDESVPGNIRWERLA